MDFEGMMLSEISQKEKDKCLYELSLCEIKEKIKKMKNPEIQITVTDCWLPEVGRRNGR